METDNQKQEVIGAIHRDYEMRDGQRTGAYTMRDTATGAVVGHGTTGGWFGVSGGAHGYTSGSQTFTDGRPDPSNLANSTGGPGVPQQPTTGVSGPVDGPGVSQLATASSGGGGAASSPAANPSSSGTAAPSMTTAGQFVGALGGDMSKRADLNGGSSSAPGRTTIFGTTPQTETPLNSEWDLDERETKEYERLVGVAKSQGRKYDDEVMKLRAMRATRGDEEVKRMAWNLRRKRDLDLAEQLAREFNGANPYTVPSHAKDFYHETTRRHIQGLFDMGEGPDGRSGKEAMMADLNREIADAVASGSANRVLDARRKAMYYSRRFGLDFSARPTSTVQEPLYAKAGRDGWMATGDPRYEFRRMDDGTHQYRYRHRINLDSPEVRDNVRRFAPRIIGTAWDDEMRRRYAGSNAKPAWEEGHEELVGTRHVKLYDGATDFSVSLNRKDREHLDSRTIGYGRSRSRKAPGLFLAGPKQTSRARKILERRQDELDDIAYNARRARLAAEGSPAVRRAVLK